MMRICCVLPALNEEETIREVAEETERYVDEVIVVDDGSSDRTAELAAESGAIVIKHQWNMGKGAALRTGFREALERGADIVVTLDTDGEHDPRDIPGLVGLIKSGKAEIVVGSRLEGKADKGPFLRRLSRGITTSILGTLFGVHLSDTQSGFRCFSRSALERISFESDSFVAESEILIDAARKRLKIGETPISYTHIGGHFPILKETALFTLLCLRKLLHLS